MISKFWFSICLIYLFYNISILIDDTRSVKYISGNSNRSTETSVSFCIKLNEEFFKNFTNSSFQQNEYKFILEDLIKFGCPFYFSSKVCEQSIYLNSSYLFNYHLCFAFKKDHFNNLMINLSKTINEFLIFVYYSEKSEFFFYLHISSTKEEETRPFLMNIISNHIHQLGEGYKTDCRNYTNADVNFKSKELIFSQSSCLIECFKTKSRSLSYYYSLKDKEPLIVYQNDLKKSKEIYWKMVNNLTSEQEMDCTKQCKKRSCGITFYSFEFLNQKKYELDFKFYSIHAKPFITNFNFIFDLLSLFILFLNISLLETFPILIKKIFKNYFKNYFKKYQAYFKKIYFYFKIFIIFLSFVFLIAFSFYKIDEFLKSDYDIIKSGSFPTEIIPFYLIICVPVLVLIENKSELNQNEELNFLKDKSFAEIENLTNSEQFLKGFDDIYVQYASIRKEVNYSLNRHKVLFKSYDFKFENETNSNFLLRCYEINLEFKETRYDMLTSLSTLKIKLNHNWYIIYPLILKRQLTSKTINMFYERNLKKISIRKKSNCSHYDQHNNSCSSKTNCIDHCYFKKFKEKYSSLTIDTIIDKVNLDQDNLNKLYFNKSSDKTILNECIQKFQMSCETDYFSTQTNKPINMINQTFSFNLYFSEYFIVDNRILTFYDLLLNNLLNFVSIFIGLNINKIFVFIFKVLKKFKLLNNSKIYGWLKFTISMIGFLIHLNCLLNNALKSDLIPIEEHEFFKTIDIPNLILCFKYDENQIDINTKLTIDYLDNLTKDLNLTIFQNISFLDETYDKISFNHLNENETVKNLEFFNWFYFLNLKCFEFSFKPIKNDRYLYTLFELNFVQIELNKKAISKFYNSSSFKFYFISKKKGTHELNGIDEVELSDLNSTQSSKKMVSFVSKLYIYKIEDRFSYLKNFLTLFLKTVNLNDTTEYIENLLENLKKFNIQTRKIAGNKGQNKIEIDDELFDQYFMQIQNVSDFTHPKIVNFERGLYFSTIFEEQTRLDDYDLYFHLDSIVSTVKLVNKDTYSKVIINLLNLFSFWFNFCVLDLTYFIRKIISLFYRFYESLLALEIYLNRMKCSIAF